MRYPLLIFDWDGTLLDSIDTIVACTQATISELGLDAVPDQRIRSAIGLGLRETVDLLAPQCDDATYHGVVATYRRLWWADFHDRSHLFDGVRELLDDLRQQGHVLAVATAKTRDGLADDLGRTGIGACFAASRTVDESKSKPDPAMVRDLVAETGFEVEQTLVIGDAVHDLRMARRAGADAVAVTTGSQPRDALLAEGPLACLSHVVELRGWLRESENGATDGRQ